jgi:hypothetical protein
MVGWVCFFFLNVHSKNTTYNQSGSTATGFYAVLVTLEHFVQSSNVSSPQTSPITNMGEWVGLCRVLTTLSFRPSVHEFWIFHSPRWPKKFLSNCSDFWRPPKNWLSRVTWTLGWNGTVELIKVCITQYKMMVFNKSDSCLESRVKEIQLEPIWGYKSRQD